MDEDFRKQHAITVRAIAEKADPITRKRLLDLANRYDNVQRAPGIQQPRPSAERQAAGPSQ